MKALYEAPEAERIDFAAMESMADITGDAGSGSGGIESKVTSDDQYT